MSFIGNVPAEAYSPVAKDTFSGDDSTTDFTLSIPATTNGVEVLVENVQQEPTTAYTISGTTLSFTAAPVTGTNNIYVIHRGPAVQTVVPPAGVAIDASTITASGLVTAQDGLVVDNDGATVATFDRATSDGDIVEFQKGGTKLGSIGNVNGSAPGDLFICSSAGSHSGLSFGGGNVVPTDNTGSFADNACDLGTSSTRFKDLYLSGGVYLGGTGSANYLDDFEEGTWTPTADQGVSGFTIASSPYIKAGSLVYVQCYLVGLGTKSASALKIGGLPFNPSNDAYAPGSMESTSSGRMGIVRTQVNNDELVFYYANSSNAQRTTFLGTDLGDHLIFSVTYKTDS